MVFDVMPRSAVQDTARGLRPFATMQPAMAALPGFAHFARIASSFKSLLPARAVGPEIHLSRGFDDLELHVLGYAVETVDRHDVLRAGGKHDHQIHLGL